MKTHKHRPDAAGNCKVCGEAGRCPGLMDFALRNDPPSKPAWQPEPNRQRQTALLSGLDAIDGQLDLLSDLDAKD